ncbi:unnamed protein product [Lactuca virosa]|uniref:Uncharacterized protein n=1 Tax=Lactuca virosa TaxID=75947 RepID=A0AAU9M9L7_9ASTR|nr:unnamed protein product [Lactuca virosa]
MDASHPRLFLGSTTSFFLSPLVSSRRYTHQMTGQINADSSSPASNIDLFLPLPIAGRSSFLVYQVAEQLLTPCPKSIYLLLKVAD